MPWVTIRIRRRHCGKWRHPQRCNALASIYQTTSNRLELLHRVSKAKTNQKHAGRLHQSHDACRGRLGTTWSRACPSVSWRIRPSLRLRVLRGRCQRSRLPGTIKTRTKSKLKRSSVDQLHQLMECLKQETLHSLRAPASQLRKQGHWTQMKCSSIKLMSYFHQQIRAWDWQSHYHHIRYSRI